CARESLTTVVEDYWYFDIW
nr:immunoglobulin heavy chain junction region [Mus musculus]NSM05090.1 immunoglobulin heavy chain junction region [Mus musculus]NSM06733.1 immunoglobulin heavy chain junction region [Mus musculus]NSM06830.1 immunoglobulin heavy chain junction region [Mus musculus]NSM07199.1 immunoglobulin heavy chain junction region [Mus musculus]